MSQNGGMSANGKARMTALVSIFALIFCGAFLLVDMPNPADFRGNAALVLVLSVLIVLLNHKMARHASGGVAVFCRVLLVLAAVTTCLAAWALWG